MRNPCIGCPDRKENIGECEGPRCWDKREAYLRHIQNDGTYFDGVKSVIANDVPKQEIILIEENSISNSHLKKGAKGVVMTEKNTEYKAVDSSPLPVDGQEEPEKICKKCGESKPLSKFVANKRCIVDGYEHTCKECKKKQAEVWYAKSKSAAGVTTKQDKKLKEKAVQAAQTVQTVQTAIARQVGGNHYKNFAIQPVEFITKNQLGFLEGCVIKRICRYNREGGKGVEDLDKILHEVQLIKELQVNTPSPVRGEGRGEGQR